ncbi:MAG: hypothetical protein IK091_09935 [Spirochaetales bacterium]|nr:hypothetical protein [Spirochaetales bacterium]
MARKRFCLLALIVIALVLASCSVVFEAGISGKVVTAEGTGTSNVQDVSVFAYTDSGLRDSDFAKFQEGTITRPTEGSGYVATTTTNANGEFTVNKVVWETKNSEFGKTADVSKLYLIFYHEDYKPAKADATVISGSTNSSNVYVKLEGSKDYTTINVTVYDVATGTAMTDACNLEYHVEGKEGSDSIVVTGASNVRISYPKDTTPDVTIKLASPGSSWKMTNKTGKVITQQIVEDVEKGTLSVSLYMKRYEFTLPAFSGSVEYVGGDPMVTFDANPTNGQDNVPVWLEFASVSLPGTFVEFNETVAADNKTESVATEYGNTVRYDHGRFSGVGNDGYVITINENNEYSDAINWNAYENSTTAYISLRLVFNNDKYYDFIYTFPYGATSLYIENGDLQP